MKLTLTLMLTAALATGTAAHAQFVASHAGPLHSSGPIGDSANGVFFETYGGPTTLFGSMNFTGTLTSVAGPTFGSEARWNLGRVGGASANFLPGLPSGTFSQIDADVTRGGLFWMSTGSEYRFEAYESFNDSPGNPDATWTNVNFTFSGGVGVTSLGSFQPGMFDFDTFGSDFDTELGLYTAGGTLIAENDDTGGLQSQIIETLSAGEYLIVVGGFNSSWADEFALAGTASGDYLLSLNGALVGDGFLPSGQFSVYGFTVIPAPSALALLGLAGVLARRRRRN